jgi:uncharacterized OsmC-like protein
MVNGINLENINNLVDAIKQDPDIAKIKFVATSKWLGGTRTEVAIGPIYSNGNNISPPERKFNLIIDEPSELGGTDSAPNPVEYLAAALCGCITAGIATNSALFKDNLETLEVEVSVDFDLHGVLGLNDSIPNGALKINYNVNIKGVDEKTTENLKKSKVVIDKKSPIRNTLEKPLLVTTSNGDIKC